MMQRIFHLKGFQLGTKGGGEKIIINNDTVFFLFVTFVPTEEPPFGDTKGKRITGKIKIRRKNELKIAISVRKQNGTLQEKRN